MQTLDKFLITPKQNNIQIILLLGVMAGVVHFDTSVYCTYRYHFSRHAFLWTLLLHHHGRHFYEELNAVLKGIRCLSDQS